MESDWNQIGIPPTNDLLVLKKAYAEKLKLVNPEVDPLGFQELRKSYENLKSNLELGNNNDLSPESKINPLINEHYDPFYSKQKEILFEDDLEVECDPKEFSDEIDYTNIFDENQIEIELKRKNISELLLDRSKRDVSRELAQLLLAFSDADFKSRNDLSEMLLLNIFLEIEREKYLIELCTPLQQLYSFFGWGEISNKNLIKHRQNLFLKIDELVALGGKNFATESECIQSTIKFYWRWSLIEILFFLVIFGSILCYEIINLPSL